LASNTNAKKVKAKLKSYSQVKIFQSTKLKFVTLANYKRKVSKSIEWLK